MVKRDQASLVGRGATSGAGMLTMIEATTAVAVYGAVLSTYVLVRDHWVKRPRGRVRIGYTSRMGVRDGSHGFVVAATIANVGRESIFLRNCAIDVKNRFNVSNVFDASKMPAELRPGQSFTFYYDADIVAEWAAGDPAKLIRAVYTDQVGRRYVSQFVTAALVSKTESGWSLDMPKREPFYRRLFQGGD